MSSEAHLASPLANPAAAAPVDIDTLEVSDRWKTYFKALSKYGGLDATVFKALPKDQHKAARKEMQPPTSSFVLAFVFGFLYYLCKGMWKKGLVLLAIVLPAIIVLSVVFYMIGGESLANATRFIGGVVFAIMAPRDFYAVKVLRDDGWLPVRPF